MGKDSFAIRRQLFLDLAAQVFTSSRFHRDSVLADPSFDGEGARKEALVRLRGLADHFEQEDPAMHKTNTVDYAVVYDGEIWLELDDAKTVHLKKGVL